MIAFLSHVLTRYNPVYGRTDAELLIQKVKDLELGDSCNVSRITLENHWGTHVDCPAHFFAAGMKIAQYSPDTWRFIQPCVVELAAEPDRLIMPDDISSVSDNADLLLIRTGFSQYRGTELYSMHNPGLSPESGRWLRRHRPSLKAVGFDFVSVSPFQSRELGRESHRAFLDPAGENAPILIIEDMDLSISMNGLETVVALPLIVEGLDSSPCTVLGYFR